MAQALQNFDIQQVGAIKKRTGYGTYGTPSTPTVPTDLFRFVLATNLTMARLGSKIYYSTDGTSWTELLKTGSVTMGLNASTARIGYAQYKDKLYIATPYDGLFEWSGTGVCTKVGIARPTASWATGVSGTAPATYFPGAYSLSNFPGTDFQREYAYAYVTASGTGNMGPVSGLIDPVVDGILVNQVRVKLPDDSGVSGVTARVLYRRIQGAIDTDWIPVYRSTVLTATTWDDLLVRGQWEGNGYPRGIESTATVAPNGQFLARYQDRLYMGGDPSNPNYIYYSEIGKAGSWSPTLDYLLITQPSAQNVQNLVQDHDRLLIPCSDSIWANYGDPPVRGDTATNALRPVVETVGTTSPYSVINSPYGTFFYGNDGVLYKLTGDNIERISYPLEGYFFESTTDKIVATYVGDRRQIWFAAATATGNNNSLILVYDLARNEWAEYTGTRITQFLPLENAGDPVGANRIVLFLDGTAIIKKMQLAVYLDGATAITSTYKSPRIALNGQSGRFVIDHIRLDIEASSGTLTGNIYMDDVDVGDISVALSGGRSWKRVYFDQSVVGSNMALELIHASNAAFTLHGWQVAYIDRPVGEP